MPLLIKFFQSLDYKHKNTVKILGYIKDQIKDWEWNPVYIALEVDFDEVMGAIDEILDGIAERQKKELW